ncbi:DUF475 domain-containing protein [Sphingomonas sp. ID1715]|uniref:DUF475 domain-containing protein n=1 Tax=Sphingomonas sp. ID1715 TaxID=1656898 RepID=UPI001488422A|nr:DUF475 domain-containing protein [Sphingomonas sp. ID1715]
MRYFRSSFLFTALCLGIGGWLGWSATGTLVGTLSVLWIIAVLGVLETSLSFDNAVVNATVLKDMAPVWRKRFLTWGILIAVFGMRIVFPLAIVGIAAKLGPIAALTLAIDNPAEYERILTGAHIGIAGFGGAFLAMVGLTFFLDGDKDTHWIPFLERPISGLSGVAAAPLALSLLALLGVAQLLPTEEVITFLTAGIFGLIAYVAVDSVGDLIGGGDDAAAQVARAGIGGFLYLELLDASFSFDGVIGAFALSNNLFIIALGLGIGAMFVRSMTVMLVDKGTLAEYRFLEHGAFYAIVALAAIMLLSARYEIPETVTGLIGAGFIGLAFVSSLFGREDEEDAPILAGAVTPSGEAL